MLSLCFKTPIYINNTIFSIDMANYAWQSLENMS